ncbi:Cutinase transcription factor 1 alpha [Colletotrichum higginsianum]|uniref:Cutinase transcription factor 1 alpha n=1 Tax=Colletotrichum higginsianum TaxID=80884 RepID=A0A4T0VL21_9PEZI|nr:Cutinase transcription factor 1 alpha [Colletotrichum higginsianum]
MAKLRRRARQACQACNARRVKCNVTEQQPCRNCATADTPCELRESRRGKHPRPPRRHDSTTSPALRDHASSPAFVDASVLEGSTNDHTDDRFAASQVLVGLARNRDHEASYEAETILPPAPEAGISPPENLRFLHSVPHAVRAKNLIPEWEIERRRTRIGLLKAEGVFSFPPRPAVETLLRAYFQWFHPCFPVVDEPDTWQKHREGRLSPLLLQAILFIAVIHCDEDALPALGFGGRHMAKWVFYNRAKDIYDVEFEPKKLTVIQSLFLMSFWRAGLLLEKDARHWLGAAISLAQTKALHRSSRAAAPDQNTERVQRRLWWSIYTRERQCAAALGLPNRIRDEDCDVEPMDRRDFEHAFNPALPTSKTQGYISYFIGIAQLSRALGRIVHGGYLPSKSLSASDRSHIKDDLARWRQSLPPAMQVGGDDLGGNTPSFHANMLHLAYNNLLILLYRSGCIGTAEESREIDGQMALRAAARNSRIIEDMLLEGNLRHGQIHVITNLFNTLCIHTVNLRASKGAERAIIEHRAKLCLLGLQELQKTWEVRMWVLQLFFQYLDRSTAARLRMQDDNGLMPGTENDNGSCHAPARAETNGQGPLARSSETYDESGGLDTLLASETPWSWSTEEANQFLFTQIENDFAFGEGGILDWNPDTSNSVFPVAGDDTPATPDF